jgi:hypothetical protein
MTQQREEWPVISRGGRGGNPPTEIQLKIIECLKAWGMAPFGESSTEEELLEHMTSAQEDRDHKKWETWDYYVPNLTAQELQDELFDAVLAGWVKMTPWGYDVGERPRPERTDLPVEDRERRKQIPDEGGVWIDAQGARHVVSPGGIEMAFEGGASDEDVVEIMKEVDAVIKRASS